MYRKSREGIFPKSIAIKTCQKQSGRNQAFSPSVQPSPPSRGRAGRKRQGDGIASDLRVAWRGAVSRGMAWRCVASRSERPGHVVWSLGGAPPKLDLLMQFLTQAHDSPSHACCACWVPRRVAVAVAAPCRLVVFLFRLALLVALPFLEGHLEADSVLARYSSTVVCRLASLSPALL